MTFAAQILTLYPEMFPGPLGQSLARRSLMDGKWYCDPIQIRDFAADKTRSVDDTPAGGGAGTVTRTELQAGAAAVAPPTPPTAQVAEQQPRTQEPRGAQESRTPIRPRRS